MGKMKEIVRNEILDFDGSDYFKKQLVLDYQYLVSGGVISPINIIGII